MRYIGVTRSSTGRSAFDAELFRLLKEDAEAQDKVPGEIVGLDFDPILNSQDPSKRYVVGAITRKRDSYWAEVYSIRSGKKNKKRDVVAEVKLKMGAGSSSTSIMTMIPDTRRTKIC